MTEVEPAAAPEPTAQRFRTWVCAAVGLSVVLRLRYLWLPITNDEGGYLAVARAWRHGATPYVDAWVDRPQGLWVLFRVFDTLGGDAAQVRWLALAFGALGVLAVSVAVRAVAGEHAGVVAAFLAAVASTGPAIEGYAANGELLSGAVSAVCVAVACLVLMGRRPDRWMYLAGLAGGAAWSLKQSGVDGALTVAAWLVLAAAFRRLPWRAGLAHLGRLVAGAGSVVGLAVLHGAWVGFGSWWYAMAGYRLDSRSVATGADWDNLRETLPKGGALLFPMLAIGLVVAAVVRFRGRPVMRGAVPGLLVVWMAVAVLTFASGGQFFRHYWVTLTFPAAALAGLLIGSAPARVRLAAVVAVAAVAAVPYAALTFESRHDLPIEAGDGPRLEKGERAGYWIRDHRQPGERVYAMCAAANFYAYADADPPFRYLWFDGVHKGRDGQARLSKLFTEDPPEWVVLFDRPESCSSDPQVAAVVEERYETVTEVSGLRILRLLD